jgi:hypothetical protein
LKTSELAASAAPSVMIAPGVVGIGVGKITSSSVSVGLAPVDQLPPWSQYGSVALPPSQVLVAPSAGTPAAPTAANSNGTILARFRSLLCISDVLPP